MFPKKRIPAALLAGRRAVEEIKGVLLLQDWLWNEQINRWVLYCRLSPNVDPNGPIPPKTDWYIFADPTYPLGNIKFYPAQKEGLDKTFHHQLYNGRLSRNGPWRTGEICLDSTVATLNRHAWTGEPYTANERLPYYVRRALSWLEAASSGQLTQLGDPFELPDFSVDNSVTLAFSENASSFDFWQTIEDRVGIADLASFKPDIFYTRSFRSTTEKGILSIPWGPF